MKVRAVEVRVSVRMSQNYQAVEASCGLTADIEPRDSLKQVIGDLRTKARFIAVSEAQESLRQAVHLAGQEIL